MTGGVHQQPGVLHVRQDRNPWLFRTHRGGSSSNWLHHEPLNAHVSDLSTMKLLRIVSELRPAAGFTYDAEAVRLQDVVEYQGGSSYTACKSLGAGVIWTPESGLASWLDSSQGPDFTLAQMREFHAALGRILGGCHPGHES